MIGLMKKHMDLTSEAKVLDIACGKGPVAIKIAKELGITVQGYDILPAFIEEAKLKAQEWGVGHLCSFVCADANEVIDTERDYDCVILGGAGCILGSPRQTMAKLAATIKPGGCFLYDEAYLADESSLGAMKYEGHDYLTRGQWLSVFDACGLTLVEELQNIDESELDKGNLAIALRCAELAVEYPEKRAMFEGYVQSQLDESDDLLHNMVAVTWMLQKKDPASSENCSSGNDIQGENAPGNNDHANTGHGKINHGKISH